jgi:hypothetical protein
LHRNAAQLVVYAAIMEAMGEAWIDERLDYLNLVGLIATQL